jgi:hypothetical protein
MLLPVLFNVNKKEKNKDKTNIARGLLMPEYTHIITINNSPIKSNKYFFLYTVIEKNTGIAK